MKVCSNDKLIPAYFFVTWKYLKLLICTQLIILPPSLPIFEQNDSFMLKSEIGPG